MISSMTDNPVYITCNTQEDVDGVNMCTTASLVVGIAITCPVTDLLSKNQDEIREKINEIMLKAKTAHEKVFGMDAINIHDFLRQTGINLDRMCLQMHECVSCPNSIPDYMSNTISKMTYAQMTPNENKNGPILTPSTDVILPNFIPDLLIPQKNDPFKCIFSIITYNGHSIMLFCRSSDRKYGHFDPFDGIFAMNLSGLQITEFIVSHFKDAPRYSEANIYIFSCNEPK